MLDPSKLRGKWGSYRQKDSGGDNNWRTPPEFFKYLDDRFHFAADVAASHENAHCLEFLTKEDDALSVPWHKRWPGETVFCNPPYGRDVGQWVDKFCEEARKGVTVVALLFPRTDTKWWHQGVMQAVEVSFLSGRVVFLDSNGEPPPGNAGLGPSCIVVWSPGYSGPPVMKSLPWREHRNNRKNHGH